MLITQQIIDQVWAKAQVVSNNDSNVYRKDQCGAWIKKDMHGNVDSQYGWEIDHITPSTDGGIDEISNLRPLQWFNNRNKQDGRLSCPVTANGTNNSKH